MRVALICLLLVIFPACCLQAQDSLEVTFNGYLPFHWETCEDITLDGDYLFCATGHSGLNILDVSDPGNPLKMGGVIPSTSLHCVAVDENRACVAGIDDLENSRLYTLDITDRAYPVLMGSCETDGTPSRLRMNGDYAYLASYGGGLRIYDISDPENPFETGVYDFPNFGRDLVIADTLAYVTFNYEGMRVINVSDPYEPNLYGSYYGLEDPHGIAVFDTTMLLVGPDDGLQVVSLHGDHFLTYCFDCFAPNAARVEVYHDAEYAFVMCNYNIHPLARNLRIINFEDFESPYEMGLLNTSTLYAECLALGDSTAFIGTKVDPDDTVDPGVTVIDASDLTAPEIISDYSTPGSINDITINGNYAYIADLEGGIQILDISDRENPHDVTHNIDPFSTRTIKINDDYIFAIGDDTVRVYSNSEPDSIEWVTDFVIEGLLDVDAEAGRIFYLATLGFGIIDFGDPQQPEHMGFFANFYNDGQLIAADTLAYISDGSIFYVMDIHNPEEIEVLYTYDAVMNIIDMEYSYPYVYLARQGDRVFVMDISDPGYVQRIPSGNFRVEEITLYDDYIFGIDSDDGVFIRDADPHNFQEMGYYEIETGLNCIAVKDNRIFTGNWFSIQMFQHTLPVPPLPFDLQEPLDDQRITVTRSTDLDLKWNTAIDLNGDFVYYEAYLSTPIGPGQDTTICATMILDTTITLDVPFSLGLGQVHNEEVITWWVNAIAEGDTTESAKRFTFIIDPDLDVENQDKSHLPSQYSLGAPYPNPFNSTVIVSFGLPQPSNLHLDIINIGGQEVERLHTGSHPAGNYSYPYNADNLASGIYFIRMEVAGKYSNMRKVVLIK